MSYDDWKTRDRFAEMQEVVELENRRLVGIMARQRYRPPTQSIGDMLISICVHNSQVEQEFPPSRYRQWLMWEPWR